MKAPPLLLCESKQSHQRQRIQDQEGYGNKTLLILHHFLPLAQTPLSYRFFTIFFFFCLQSIKVSCSHHFFRSSFSWEGSHVRAKMHSLVNLSSSSLIIRPGQKPKEGRGEFFLPTGHTNYCHLWPEQNKCHQDSQCPTSFPLLKSVLSFITYVYIHKQQFSFTYF